jgi:hypothetical protein
MKAQPLRGTVATGRGLGTIRSAAATGEAGAAATGTAAAAGTGTAAAAGAGTAAATAGTVAAAAARVRLEEQAICE